MQKNDTLKGRAIKAMLAASFAVAMFPTSVFADVRAEQNVQAQAQQQIKGNVVDELGEPMIGVTVKVKGSIEATITDLDGNYTIKANPNATIEFSYVGYVTQTIKGSSAGKVQMKPDSQMMDEVVVIGFGTVKKRDVTGSVASVKSDAILQAPTSDVATALQGRITGLDVSGGELRIRGNRSINGSNNPLVIIDGVQGGSMSDINPQDIESVDVLKDASSTAIYGSQGANGVIIITTKKADKGKMAISYDGSVTGAMRPDHPDYRIGDNYMNARRDAAIASGDWKEGFSDDDNWLNVLGNRAETFAAYKANAWTNFENVLQRSTTWSHKHTVTISGGTDKTSARFSLGYANNGSKWKGSNGHDRYTLRANIDHSAYKWLSVGTNFQLTHNRFSASPYERASTTGVELGSPYGYYDEETGKYLLGKELVQRPLTADGYVNPLIDGSGNNLYDRATYGTNVVANVYADIHPIDGLTFRTQFNTHLANSSQGDYTDASQSSFLESSGKKSVANMSKGSSTFMEWNNILTYNFKMLPEAHHLGVTLLTSWQKSMKDNLSATSYGQTLASNLWWNIGSNDGEGGSNHSSWYQQSQTFSYAGRVSYDYKSKYLFTASLRRDGASQLAAGYKWDWFPSAALAWRITDESWMSSVKGNWLDDLKIRATYGVTGNSGIGVYGTKSQITFADWSFGFQDTQANRYILGKQDANGSGYWIIGNKDTKWERSTTFDVGFDAFLINNRINIAFDWYTTKTTDLILLRSLPTSSGNDGKYATYTNIGSTKNTGVEFTINGRVIDNKKFKWNSTLSFSANRERIIELVDGDELLIGTDKERQTLMTGHPIKSYKTYKYEGIWTTAEAEEAAKYYKDANKTTTFQPGDIKVADLNGDNIIDENDDVSFVGSTSPDWFAGFNNDFKIGNFDINIYFYARYGQWAENKMSAFDPKTGGKYTNMDYWVAGTNENSLLPAVNAANQLFSYKGYQAIWFADNSFIKLKRVTLGYTLPKAALKCIGINNLRVYATVNDPLYFVKSDFQKGYDPEGNQRSFTFGLSVNF